MPIISADELLARTISDLIESGEIEAAVLLLSSELRIERIRTTEDERLHIVAVSVSPPGPMFFQVDGFRSQLGSAIRTAINNVLPNGVSAQHITTDTRLVNMDPTWRTELYEIARGLGIHNQGAEVREPLIWNNLRFRSESELRIAEALDRAGVLFYPNCKARLNSGQGRTQKESDFLVCHDGKWGILEVDGEPFHPAQRSSRDHERDRLFRSHGVRVVEHFDSERCKQSPDEVVEEFLKILRYSAPQL